MTAPEPSGDGDAVAERAALRAAPPVGSGDGGNPGGVGLLQPGFRIELHQKDLNLALEGARQMGLSLPNTATAQELFNACRAHGWAGLDHPAMVRAPETLANHTVAPEG